MSVLNITRPPQFTDPWFTEIETVWDELETAINDNDSRITTLESSIVTDVVTSLSKSGDPQLKQAVTLTGSGVVVLTQVSQNIDIGVPVASIDHGLLGGLGDDDHTIYLLADGTRTLTGNLSIGNFQLINMRVENLGVNPAAGQQGRLIFNTSDLRVKVDNGTSFVDVGVTDHGLLTGLSDDDHIIYVLADGTRAVTGGLEVQGIRTNQATTSWQAQSQVSDGASAVAYILDTSAALSTTGAKLLSVRNNGVEKFFIDKDGVISGGLSSTTSINILIDTDNDSTTETLSLKKDDPTAGLATLVMSVNEAGELNLSQGTSGIRVGSPGAPTSPLDVDGDADISGDLILSVNQIIKSPSNLTFQIDTDNDETASFLWLDGVGATSMSLDEAGNLQVSTALRVGSTGAPSSPLDVDGNADISGELILSSTALISSPSNMSFKIDTDDNEAASFFWKSGTGINVMILDESGNLTTTGTITGGASPFKFSSIVAANEGTFAFGTITIIQTSDPDIAGDIFTIDATAISGPIVSFTEGVDFFLVPGDPSFATGTAGTLAAAINASSLVGFVAAGPGGGPNDVDLTSAVIGTVGNGIALSYTDLGAPGGASISGPLFTGGTDVAPTAYELDTTNNLTLSGTKLLVIKNQGTEVWSVDNNGISTGGFVTVVQPSEGGTGISNAIDTVNAAGGGIVQLLEGTYSFSSAIVKVGLNNVTLRGIGKGTILSSDIVSGNQILSLEGTVVQSASEALNAITVGDTFITYTTVADAGSIQTGDKIIIRATDTNSQLDMQLVEATANGNPVTGVVPITPQILKTGTSPIVIQAWRNGKNLKIQDLRVIQNSGSLSRGLTIARVTNSLIENIAVEDISIASSGIGLTVDFGTHTLIRNCTSEDCNAVGIQISTCHDSHMESCVGRNNNPTAIVNSANLQVMSSSFDCSIKNSTSIGGGLHGIFIFAQGGATNRRCNIENNWVEGADGRGIVIDSNADINVISNQISRLPGISSTGAAISANSVIRGNISNNIILDVEQGVVTQGGNKLVIGDNTIEDVSPNSGISLQSSASKISVVGNVIENCGAAGIGLSVVDRTTITGNTIEGAGTDGIDLNSGTNCTINGNTTRTSTGSGISLDNSSTDNLVVGNNSNGEGISKGTGAGNVFGLNKE